VSVRVFRKCKRHDSEVKNLGTLKGRYQFLRALFLTNCVCRQRPNGTGGTETALEGVAWYRRLTIRLEIFCMRGRSSAG
jgi:hypothetical protein